jgi:hypothetical protein
VCKELFYSEHKEAVIVLKNEVEQHGIELNFNLKPTKKEMLQKC